jgi:predicted RNA-binding protein YlxR (DUF448 family)
MVCRTWEQVWLQRHPIRECIKGKRRMLCQGMMELGRLVVVRGQAGDSGIAPGRGGWVRPEAEVEAGGPVVRDVA